VNAKQHWRQRGIRVDVIGIHGTLGRSARKLVVAGTD